MTVLVPAFMELPVHRKSQVELKLFISDWDLNPHGWDLNLAKTPSLPTEITHLVSGLNEAQMFDVLPQKESSERQRDR